MGSHHGAMSLTEDFKICFMCEYIKGHMSQSSFTVGHKAYGNKSCKVRPERRPENREEASSGGGGCLSPRGPLCPAGAPARPSWSPEERPDRRTPQRPVRLAP